MLESLALALALAVGHLAHKELDGLGRTGAVGAAVLEAGAGCDGEEAAGPVEGEGSYAGAKLLVLAQAAFSHAVPEADDGVAAAGGKGAVDGMEGEGVDGVDDVDAGLQLAVALEGVLLGLAGVAGVEELDGDAALDRRRGVAEPVGHAGDGARLELERRLAALPGRGHVAQVVQMDAAGRHGHDESVAGGSQRVDLLRLGVLRGQGG